jgi:galactonate dehydratase
MLSTRMKITGLQTFLTNSGLRNYLFLLLSTDAGITGLGEASLEWQEKTVETVVHEWVVDRVIGADPFAAEELAADLVRDQYQGGSTIMTAISGVEMACWDIMGKALGKPVYELLGGRCHDRLPSYANGWYGGARSPAQYAEKALSAVEQGYSGLKLDPFGTAWKTLTQDAMDDAEALVAAVREATGPGIDIMVEFHGRLDVPTAIAMGRRLGAYRACWFEEPVTPNSLDQLKTVKDAVSTPIAAGERLYTLEDFERLARLGAADVVQMDPAHCGGLGAARKIAAIASERGMTVSPHCSIGPVALCAAVHLDWATPNVRVQESFAQFDVPWRKDYVFGREPWGRGEFLVPEGPGLGLELDTRVCESHPYRKNTFPSLWDKRWLTEFTKSGAADLPARTPPS